MGREAWDFHRNHSEMKWTLNPQKIGPLAVCSFEDNKAIGMKARYSSQALESLAHGSAKVEDTGGILGCHQVARVMLHKRDCKIVCVNGQSGQT